MTTPKVRSGGEVLEIPVAAVRRLFRTSPSLMANRPLREVTAPASEPAAVLSKAELEALEEVGCSTKPWTVDAAQDPIVKTIVDYMALLETSLSTAEAAAILNVDVSRIRQRIRERTLFGIEYEGEWRLPRFQFERKKVLPGLAEVLSALPVELNPLDVATWFLRQNVDLEIGEEGVPGESQSVVTPWRLAADDRPVRSASVARCYGEIPATAGCRCTPKCSPRSQNPFQGDGVGTGIFFWREPS